MDVHVGPFLWRVRLHRGLIEHDDGPALGVCDYRSQTILVSDDVPGDRRVAVICHELWHAWRFHFPVALSDEESSCDYFAALALSLVRDLFGELPKNMTHPPEAKRGDLIVLRGRYHPGDGSSSRVTMYLSDPAPGA